MPISAKTLDFLFENKLNNSKEWYHAHKKEYTELVLRPLAELVVKLKPTMLELDPDLIVEPRVTRSISRIYRDTRFSKDKSLYRDNMWLIFIRDKKLYEGPPGFYVDISPRGLSYGMGYYLYQVVAQHFRLLKPVYEFLMAVETRRDHTSPGSR